MNSLENQPQLVNTENNNNKNRTLIEVKCFMGRMIAKIHIMT